MEVNFDNPIKRVQSMFVGNSVGYFKRYRYDGGVGIILPFFIIMVSTQ